MIDHIDAVLELLDSEKDHLLIELLKQKRESKVKIGSFQFSSDLIYQVNKNISFLMKEPSLEIVKNDKFLNRLKAIDDNSNCDDCKFAVTIEKEDPIYGPIEPYKWMDETRIGCQRCFEKTTKIYSYIRECESYSHEFLKKNVPNDIIETKALIFTIQHKLKELKTK